MNTFGRNITLTIFGESHGPCIGAVLDGLPAGIAIDEGRIAADMNKRKAKGRISTQRHEADQVHIVSGLFEGKTCGTALTFLIENKAQHSKDYDALRYRLRPGHADFAAFEKYHGHQDFRGGGHFSGRITAALTAAGSICRQILESKGVLIASHMESLHGIADRPFQNLEADMALLNTLDFAVLDETAKEKMMFCIEDAAAQGDSVGGILETVITGLPAGLGDPFFDSVESELSHLLFSVPAVKGVSFGEGFGFADLYGSQANDAFIYDEGIKTETNRNGGINGGITNGMPVRIHTAVKPTPSIYKPQKSVDYATKEETTLQIQGRHDPCILHRARIVIESAAAFGLLDLWMAWAAQEAL